MVLKLKLHLLAVKQDDKLQGVDSRQQRTKESSCPDHSLTVNQPEHIGGNHKLLPAHPLNGLTGTFIHHKPTAVKKKPQSWTQDWLTSIQIYSMHLHDIYKYITYKKKKTTCVEIQPAVEQQRWWGGQTESACTSPVPHVFPNTANEKR